MRIESELQHRIRELKVASGELLMFDPVLTCDLPLGPPELAPKPAFGSSGCCIPQTLCLPLAKSLGEDFVIGGGVEASGSRIALAGATADQLSVDSKGCVRLTHDDVESTGASHGGRELNIGSPARHVGCDGDAAGLPCLRDNACLGGWVPRIEDNMLDLPLLEPLA